MSSFSLFPSSSSVRRLLLVPLPKITAVPTTSTTSVGIVPAPRRLPSRSYCHSCSPRLLLRNNKTRPSASSSSLVPQTQIQSGICVTSQLRHTSTSTSTSAMAVKKEFLCIIPDKPGMMAKRVEVRPTHLANVKPLVDSGRIVVGGAMLESHPAEGEDPKFKGSMLVALAESAAEVRELLSRDIYATEGVWDLENAQIIPFKSAVRVSL
ncbi:hypothetical protein M432DRAFT_587335 [Thermoascus aurantiacus ATCC 26904]